VPAGVTNAFILQAPLKSLTVKAFAGLTFDCKMVSEKNE
jgi:hypothetical protein